MFEISDTEFLLARQRNAAVSEGNAIIDQQSADLAATRTALSVVKAQLAASEKARVRAQAEVVILRSQLKRALGQ